jgi:hypothetical protein
LSWIEADDPFRRRFFDLRLPTEEDNDEKRCDIPDLDRASPASSISVANPTALCCGGGVTGRRSSTGSSSSTSLCCFDGEFDFLFRRFFLRGDVDTDPAVSPV